MNTTKNHYIPKTLKKGKGKSYKNQTNNRGRREGITYRNVCQYCNETRHLTRIRRASGDLHLCREHARAILGEEGGLN